MYQEKVSGATYVPGEGQVQLLPMLPPVIKEHLFSQ